MLRQFCRLIFSCSFLIQTYNFAEYQNKEKIFENFVCSQWIFLIRAWFLHPNLNDRCFQNSLATQYVLFHSLDEILHLWYPGSNLLVFDLWRSGICTEWLLTWDWVQLDIDRAFWKMINEHLTQHALLEYSDTYGGSAW